MKKKILLTFVFTVVLLCFLAMGVSAAVTIYDDFDVDALENIEYRKDDIVVFDDGFSCPSVYVFKDTKTIGRGNWGSPDGLKKVLDFTYINEKVAPTVYGFDDVDSLDIPQGVTSMETYACHSLSSIRVISIPDTAVTLGSAIFQNASGLEYCIMEHGENSTLTTLTGSLFSGSGLKAFSMPDCITALPSGYEFQNCKKLTAVYLSKNLTSITGSGACFDYCGKMYLVNEPFMATSEAPEKPTVYYFPSNLTTFSTAGTFRGSNSINDVLVFGTKYTATTSTVAFQNCPANTVVFLGDMTNVDSSGKYSWGTQNFIFANANDKSASDLTLALQSRQNAYFCYGDNASHLVEKALLTEATCENPKMTANYCYCGQIVGTPITEGDALGHKYEGAETYEFTSLVVGGKKCTACLNGCGNTEEITLKPIFDDYGYSVSTYGEKKTITNGYYVETTLLAIYESQKGVTVNFGFAFNLADTFTDGTVTLDSFAINAPLSRNSGEIVFAAHEFKIFFENNEHLDTEIIVAAYVIEVGENETKELSFINRTFDNGVNGFEAVSYNSIIG